MEDLNRVDAKKGQYLHLKGSFFNEKRLSLIAIVNKLIIVQGLLEDNRRVDT